MKEQDETRSRYAQALSGNFHKCGGLLAAVRESACLRSPIDAAARGKRPLLLFPAQGRKKRRGAQSGGILVELSENAQAGTALKPFFYSALFGLSGG
jgi:hypothetical protein